MNADSMDLSSTFDRPPCLNKNSKNGFAAWCAERLSLSARLYYFKRLRLVEIRGTASNPWTPFTERQSLSARQSGKPRILSASICVYPRL